MRGRIRTGLELAGVLLIFARTYSIAAQMPALDAAPGEFATLRGNTRPEATAANDRGRVSDDMPLDHLMLQLRRSPEREQALQQFIQDVHNPKSPLFHHWITAAEFGKAYGATAAETDAVTSWLESQGFKVNLVYLNQMVIDFSGSAGQIRQAFRVEIHNLMVNGEPHIANMSDPQIPVELVSTVAGVVSLNDFRPHPMLRQRAGFRANYTDKEGYYPIVPADLATIYNLNPAFTAGYSGQGQTVVLVEDTDLYTTADWNTFRSVMGLASAYPAGSLAQVHPPSNTNNCTDPGYNSDDIEATLDVEWASAAAPSASIELASCSDTDTNFGGFIALQNLLNAIGTPPAIVSISYGESESYLGASFNAYISSLYQQAVTEGVSVFVSSGDEGAASSDADQAYAQSGISVSGFTSTPYNVSVGGTDFADTYEGANATYWNSTNTANYGSARSYVPEIPWNDSCASVLIADYTGMLPTSGSGSLCDHGYYITTASGSGGPSGCASGAPDVAGVVGGTCVGYPKPSWQSGMIGNPNDGVRDIPDVSLFAANGVWSHYYVFCFSDPSYGMNCNGTPDTWAGAGGTSFASPIMASIQSLVNQASGSNWGNPDSAYYALAAAEYGSGNASCSSALGNAVGTNCIFYDVTPLPLLYTGSGTGADIDVPCFGLSCYKPSGAWGVLSSTGQTLTSAEVTNLGSGYTSAPSCTLSGGGGSEAACSASLSGVVTSARVVNGGSGYTSYPDCTLTGGGGTGATCIAYICTNYQVCYVAVASYGSGYTSAPKCTISGGGGTGATCAVTEAKGIAVSLTAAGSDYTTMPHCTLSGGGGTGGTCAAFAINSSKGYQAAFSASTGWDFATGIGTVNAANLVNSFIPGSVSFSSLRLAFSPQTLATISAPQSVTLTNVGTGSLTISAVAISGPNASDFTKSADSCTGATVAPQGTCSVSVTFTPSAGGNRGASLNFTDGAANSPQIVSLTGTGAGVNVTLSPTSLTFASQDTGTGSSAQTATLTNTGKTTLQISSIALGGFDPSPFAQTHTCGATLSAGASCTISVTFAPSAAGLASATLTVTDDATGGSQSLTLLGTGVAAPVVGLSPSTLTFGTQGVGTPSAAQTVTLHNTGTAALSITSIAFGGTNPGQFSQSHACGATLSAGAQCTISVTFKPTTAGSMSASVTITDNAPNSPQSITLSGTGVRPTVSVSPSSLSFGSQAVEGSTSSQTVMLTNTSAVTLNITSIAVTGTNPHQFVQSSTCGTTLSAGANCTVSVTFAPTAPASMSASLTFTDSTASSSQSVALTGTGTGPAVSLSTSSITFANQALNTTSAAQVVTVMNTGNTALSISSIALTGSYANAFGETTTCGSSLSAGAKCMISVTFTPGLTGKSTAALTLTDNAPQSPQSLSLSGTGVTAPAVTISPTSLSFGSQAVGTSSNYKQVNLWNPGSATLSIKSIALTGTNPHQFVQSNTCTATLTPGSVCSFWVTFAPTAPGSMSASLTITDNAGNSSQSVALTGPGTGPAVSLSPSSIVFANQTLSTTSSLRVVTITNTGNATLSISSIAITGANAKYFGETSTCGSSVSAGASCTISLIFAPVTSGATSASLAVTDNAPSNPQSVALSGTGVAKPAAILSSTSLSFGSQASGTSSAAQTVTVTNTGTAAPNITSIAFGGHKSWPI